MLRRIEILKKTFINQLQQNLNDNLSSAMASWLDKENYRHLEDFVKQTKEEFRIQLRKRKLKQHFSEKRKVLKTAPITTKPQIKTEVFKLEA